MSQWGTLGASFTYDKPISDWSFKTLTDAMPTGSESGPSVHRDDASASAGGRLRDVTDLTHSAAILAWFIDCCTDMVSPMAAAEIEWDFDGGPRYRYAWRHGELTKLRGILD